MSSCQHFNCKRSHSQQYENYFNLEQKKKIEWPLFSFNFVIQHALTHLSQARVETVFVE